MPGHHQAASCAMRCIFHASSQILSPPNPGLNANAQGACNRCQPKVYRGARCEDGPASSDTERGEQNQEKRRTLNKSYQPQSPAWRIWFQGDGSWHIRKRKKGQGRGSNVRKGVRKTNQRGPDPGRNEARPPHAISTQSNQQTNPSLFPRFSPKRYAKTSKGYHATPPTQRAIASLRHRAILKMSTPKNKELSGPEPARS